MATIKRSYVRLDVCSIQFNVLIWCFYVYLLKRDIKEHISERDMLWVCYVCRAGMHGKYTSYIYERGTFCGWLSY